MFSRKKAIKFSNTIFKPLFQGEPEFPYNLIYDEWEFFRIFLAERGIVTFNSFTPCKAEHPPKSPEKLKQADFLIQIIMADVLRKVGVIIRNSKLVDIQSTEKRAVDFFLALADEFFPFRENTPVVDDIDSVDSFEKLASRFQGKYAQLLKGACQRLDFFYKEQGQKRLNPQNRKNAVQISYDQINDIPIKRSPAKLTEVKKSTEAEHVFTEKKVLKEKIVEHLFTTVSKQSDLQYMVRKVNFKINDDNQKIKIKLRDAEKGILVVGEAGVDLRDILLHLFSEIKPKTEQLLNLIVSKIHPERKNLIEFDYDSGVSEFELSIMIEEGYFSKDIRAAIEDCNAETTFPKIVSVCANIFEEILGKKVNVTFTQKGDIVLELPEISEINSKSMADELHKEIEGIILKREEQETRKQIDPEQEVLDRIALEVEAEAERDNNQREEDSTTEIDDLEAELMKIAMATQPQEPKAVVQSNKSTTEKEES